MKHTKGKWKYDDGEGGKYFPYVKFPGTHNTLVCNQSGSMDENAANAKLIAAAPDLLQDHETDIDFMEGALKDLKAKKWDLVKYNLELLLVSKKAIIKKATS